MRKTNVKSSAIPPQEDIDSMSLADILESVQKDENSQLDFSNLSCEAVPSKANGQHNDVKNSSSDVSSQKPAVVQITSKSSSRPSAKHKAPSTPEVVPTKLHSSEITHLDALSQLLSTAVELKSKKKKRRSKSGLARTSTARLKCSTSSTERRFPRSISLMRLSNLDWIS